MISHKRYAAFVPTHIKCLALALAILLCHPTMAKPRPTGFRAPSSTQSAHGAAPTPPKQTPSASHGTSSLRSTPAEAQATYYAQNVEVPSVADPIVDIDANYQSGDDIIGVDLDHFKKHNQWRCPSRNCSTITNDDDVLKLSGAPDVRQKHEWRWVDGPEGKEVSSWPGWQTNSQRQRLLYCFWNGGERSDSEGAGELVLWNTGRGPNQPLCHFYKMCRWTTVDTNVCADNLCYSPLWAATVSAMVAIFFCKGHTPRPATRSSSRTCWYSTTCHSKGGLSKRAHRAARRAKRYGALRTRSKKAIMDWKPSALAAVKSPSKQRILHASRALREGRRPLDRHPCLGPTPPHSTPRCISDATVTMTGKVRGGMMRSETPRVTVTPAAVLLAVSPFCVSDLSQRKKSRCQHRPIRRAGVFAASSFLIRVAVCVVLAMLVMLATPAQAEYTVSTFAGSTKGTWGFNYPIGIAVSPDGLTVYICDERSHRIRKVTGGVVSTFAGPSGTAL